MSTVLERVCTPADLKPLSPVELAQLAGEIRQAIIRTVSRTGGHLAANLGVVELTIALLKVFDPPRDRIVWDTGHQAYAYKILTGRKERFATLRQLGGLSGFLRRDESEFDAFGAGHAGTALSAALGMAVARDRAGQDHHVLAVLGDGAAGCGISFEALNNLSAATQRLIVVLNDNEMSIAENVGSLARYLGGLLANPRYNRWKGSVESVATRMKMGWLRSWYYRVEEALKSLFLRSVIFEEFGLRYVGPVDGHNLAALTDALTVAKGARKPILIHVSTRKGKGYAFAEDQPEKWHGSPRFDIDSGDALAASGLPTYSGVFAQTLERLAEQDGRIMAITAAMKAGTGLSRFAERFPDRFFDVGISEEHAAVFAAGLAAEGLVPVFAVYSTFLQRAVDCVIHDVCLQNLPVVFCIDRAGVVGDDGPTHHGVFDLALLSPVPGLVIMQPKDEAELANMVFTATRLRKPVLIRYPRGPGPGAPIPDRFQEIPIGKAQIVCAFPGLPESRVPQAHAPYSAFSIQHPAFVWLWSLGDMLPVAEEAAGLLAQRGIPAGVVNARFVRPLDQALLAEQAAAAVVFATLENGVVTGGFGSRVSETLRNAGFQGRILNFGWPDEFVEQGSTAELMRQHGLTAAAVAHSIAAATTNDP